jgi:hypothetical protein
MALYCWYLIVSKSACATYCNKSNHLTYSIIIPDAYHPTRHNILCVPLLQNIFNTAQLAPLLFQDTVPNVPQ